MRIQSFPLVKVEVKMDLKPVVDNWVFKLHYRYTYYVFMIGAMLATFYASSGEVTFSLKVKFEFIMCVCVF